MTGDFAISTVLENEKCNFFKAENVHGGGEVCRSKGKPLFSLDLWTLKSKVDMWEKKKHILLYSFLTIL